MQNQFWLSCFDIFCEKDLIAAYFLYVHYLIFQQEAALCQKLHSHSAVHDIYPESRGRVH